jgi:small subunit ribosomal protein S21
LVIVTVRDNEPFEKALRRFRRKVEREGIRKDIKKNSFYLKPGEKRRLKQRLAEKRRRKAARRAQRKAPMKGPTAP